MKLFAKAADGGDNSGVTGYFLIEWKRAFSIVLLHFAEGTREAFHEHAFNAVTLWLTGRVYEHILHHVGDDLHVYSRVFTAGKLKFTPRHLCHKINALTSSWAISIRGPWVDTWREWRSGRYVTLTHGRKEIT